MNERTNDPAHTARIAVIHAAWHKLIVERCRESFIDEMERLGCPKALIDVYEVPGSLEIPLEAKLLAKSRAYAAIAAIGLVVDGGIYRHDFVASSVIDGMMRVQLDTEVPVLSAVLTPHRFHEHDEHHQFFLDHMTVKGRELAAACVATIKNVAIARDVSSLRGDSR